jgi:hypothetical protein
MAFCPQSRTFDQNLRFSPVYNPNGQEIPAVAVNSRIIEFYSGTEPDHRGRYLQEIQRWADNQLEKSHDYIQWLFPLPEPSSFNVAAPVLNRRSIEEFRARADLQEKLLFSFTRMLNFYGLEVRSGERVTITRAPNFAAKATVWLSPGNHNHLRITRILRCLTVLGLESEAKAFFGCLSEIYEDEQNKRLPAISDETVLYWKEAVGDSARTEQTR